MKKIETIPEYIEAIRNYPMEIGDEKQILRTKYGICFHDFPIAFKGNFRLMNNFLRIRGKLIGMRNDPEGRGKFYEYRKEEDFVNVRIENPASFTLRYEKFEKYRKDFDFSVCFPLRAGVADKYKSTNGARNKTISVLEYAIKANMKILFPVNSNLVGNLFYPSKEEVLGK